MNADPTWGLSAGRRWVYVKHIGGVYQRLHRVTGALLAIGLFVIPWVNYHGRPLVRFDLPARRSYLFGQVFVASQAFDLVLIGLLAAFSLFFFTALFGRVWCGYVCPQSVTLEEWIRPLENWIEGDRATRMRRDLGPLTFDKVWRRAAKYLAFAAVSVLLAGSIQSWFAGARNFWSGQAGPMDYTLVGIVATGLFVDWVWFREQLCNFLCPYARFQGALTDAHSLTISYDRARGEPRGRGKAAAAAGNCIDCKKCVDVCPAGIDIRNGFQLECIACARCVDACETVMPKLGHPSLVRYSTVNADEGKATRFFRPRTLIYAGILTLVAGALASRIVTRQPLEMTVNRTPGSLFTVDADGAIRNTYLVHVTNNDPDHGHIYVVSVHNLEGAQLVAPPVELGALESKTVPLAVRVPSTVAQRTDRFDVRVSEVGTDHKIERTATFKAPERSAE